MICTIICKCFNGTALQEECIAECVEESDFGEFPQDCAECIFAHENACSTLEIDCEPLCEEPQPPPGLPDAGIRFDAPGGP